MHELLPEGEDLRRAVKWISAHLQDHADKTVPQLINEAVFKFDLSPRDANFLIELLRKPQS